MSLLLNRKRQRIRSEGRERNQLQWNRSAGTEPAWPSRNTNIYIRGKEAAGGFLLWIFSLKQHSVAFKCSLPLARGHLGGSVPYGLLISPVLDTDMFNILSDHSRKETLPALLGML